jgi:hypothetical protein
LTEDDIRRFEDLQKYNREYIHGMLAVEAGRLKHILPEESHVWTCKEDEDVKRGSDADIEKVTKWEEELQRQLRTEIESNEESSLHLDDDDEGCVVPMEELLFPQGFIIGEEEEKEGEDDDASCLNEEQRRAYDIVGWHLQKTLAGERPPQLRMILLGEGGTGKSRVVRAISAKFERLHVKEMLVKGAYTGIAASIIDGRTLHVLTAMPLKGVRSAKTMKKLAEFWKNKKYLIIDEMSMLSRQFLAKLSKIITTVLCCDDIGDDSLPFGGLNVVLVGDFHQFPPVVAGRAAPLYYPNNQHFDNTD